MQDFIDTWNINNRVNLYLLDNIKEEHLVDLLASKGRNVGQQFVHVHNVRLMWLKAATPDLLEGLANIDKDEQITKAMLAETLTKSAEAVTKLLQKGFAEGRVKGFKPSPAAFFGYMISHDSHHRGQIILALKQSGHPIDKKIQYGIWEWGKFS